jgi:hypothetical protein
MSKYIYPPNDSFKPVLNAGLNEYGDRNGHENTDLTLLECELAGTHYAKLSEHELDELPFGPGIELVREPNNPYDSFAIRAQTKEGRKLGYIPRAQNETLARLMDAGREVYVELEGVTLDVGNPDIEIEVFMK